MDLLINPITFLVLVLSYIMYYVVAKTQSKKILNSVVFAIDYKKAKPVFIGYCITLAVLFNLYSFGFASMISGLLLVVSVIFSLFDIKQVPIWQFSLLMFLLGLAELGQIEWIMIYIILSVIIIIMKKEIKNISWWHEHLAIILIFLGMVFNDLGIHLIFQTW